MAYAGSPPLLPGTRARCRREPFGDTADRLTLRQVPGRLGLAVLVGVGATLLAWGLPSLRHRPPQAEAGWPGALAFGVVLAACYLYGAVLRPLFRPAPNYRLVGEFVVREKYEAFGNRLLRIGLADAQVVYVGPGLYEQLRAGDWVQVLYTAEGSLVSCTKWAGAAGN